MMRGLFGSWNNSFFLGTKNWHINFNKFNQEIFKNIDKIGSDIFIINGPGSFIGTRSVVSFALGYTFQKKHMKIYGFSILLDILPKLYKNKCKNENILYIYMDLERFFYCIYGKDLDSRNFFLLQKDQVDEILSNGIYGIGNYSKCNFFIETNYKNIFHAVEELYEENKDFYYFKEIEYCGKFS